MPQSRPTSVPTGPGRMLHPARSVWPGCLRGEAGRLHTPSRAAEASSEEQRGLTLYGGQAGRGSSRAHSRQGPGTLLSRKNK